MVITKSLMISAIFQSQFLDQKDLMVPVVRNAENLTFRGVEAEIKRLAFKSS